MDLHSPTLAPFLAQLRMGKWLYICSDILAISWHLVALSSSLSVIRILDYADVLQTFRRLTQLQLELHHFMAPFALQLCPKVLFTLYDLSSTKLILTLVFIIMLVIWFAFVIVVIMVFICIK